MKKRAAILLISLVALLIPLVSAGLPVYGAGSFNIAGYTIDVSVNTDGSADIEERLTYDFSGKFNGALRDVDFSRTDGIFNQKVYVLKDGNEVEYVQNRTDSLSYSGRPGTFNFVKDGSLAHFKIFEPSDSERKTFIIKYRFSNVVTKYNDVAEFNRKLIDTGWQTRLDNVDIKIRLPEGASKDDIRVFAHGPLTGESSILDGQNTEFRVPYVLPGDFVETLVVFPTRLVPDSTNIVNQDALPQILANEGKLADEANRQREEARRQIAEQQQAEQQRQAQLALERKKLQEVGMPLAILLFLLWFPLIIYIYYKYDKELSHNFEGKYYRELPGEYTPAEMSVLMSMGSVHSRDIMATLMDLIRKKALVLSTEKIHKKKLFGSSDITAYTVSINDSAPDMKLKSHERYLVDWFVGKIGDGNSVSLDDIEDYVRKRSNALQYKSDYGMWEKLVKEEAAKNEFFDNTSAKGRLTGVLSGVGYLIAGIVLTALLATYAAIILVVPGIILTIFSARIKRRTAYGNEQHAMWHAFRNFLRDFSRLDRAEIPSIVIWEHYLVYAVSLGVAKEVIHQLPLVFSDSDLDNRNLTFMYGASYGHFVGFTSMFEQTSRTVENAIYTATSIANSSNSSGSGFGGGFSGGSSGGGGGGGGGGAF